jgi:multidrug efflux system membrane fusion protein
MKRSIVIAIVLAIAAVAWIGSGQIGASNQPKVGEKPAADLTAAATLPSVRVRVSQAQVHVARIVLRGQTEADRKVNIKAETQGRIAELRAAKGKLVKEGDVLARIDPEERPARLAEAKSLREQRRIEYEAAKRLAEKGFRAETQLAAARAALDAADAGVKFAEIALKYLEIKAPFDGVIVDRFVEIGDFVDVGDQIARVLDLDPLLVVVQVSERDAGRLTDGSLAQSRLVTGQTVEGAISYVSSEADSATRTFRVEIEVDNPSGLLPDGVSAEVQLPLQQVVAHQISPAILTLSDTGAIGVKTVNAADEIVFMPVRIVDEGQAGVWITGLPERVTLVTVGQEFVTEGQKVQPIDEATLSPTTESSGGAVAAGDERDGAS